ncbi:uncharacterized protein BKA78DRAFT_9424 [Phyllosticta capitalensis]|uniref:uncharacterized protein n=1 Tax=Phyllosticta capitalensis TaxID=121624 RepID=UPI0031320C4A
MSAKSRKEVDLAPNPTGCMINESAPCLRFAATFHKAQCHAGGRMTSHLSCCCFFDPAPDFPALSGSTFPWTAAEVAGDCPFWLSGRWKVVLSHCSSFCFCPFLAPGDKETDRGLRTRVSAFCDHRTILSRSPNQDTIPKTKPCNGWRENAPRRRLLIGWNGDDAWLRWCPEHHHGGQRNSARNLEDESK